MRKLWKALVGILAAVAMLFTGGVLAATASADEVVFHTLRAGEANTKPGSVTVKNVKDGQTYKVYQMLTLETNSDYSAFKYKAAEGWTSFLSSQSDYVTVDGDGYVTWKKIGSDGSPSDADVQAFAQAALAYAKDMSNKIGNKGYYKRTVNEDGTVTEDKSGNAMYTAAQGKDSAKVMFSGLDLGYYLVESTTGALVSLSTTDPDADTKDKNEVPPVDKQVQEDSKKDDPDGGWGEKNDAEIGDTVNFKTTIQVKPGAVNYVLHDKMSAGLTFNKDSVEVKLVKNGQTTEDTVAASNYEVRTDDKVSEKDEDKKCAFEVSFNNDYLASLSDGDQLVVKYSATVNENAVIGNVGNSNDTYLGFGDNQKTEHDTTKTYVWEFNVYKYAQLEDEKLPLAGATFKLTTDQAGNDAIEFVKKAENSYRVFKTGTDQDADKVTEFTTGTAGEFTLSGLDSGTYWLHEINAPDGYNKLDGPIKVVIKGTNDTDSMGKIVYTIDGTDSQPTDTVNVLNQAGSKLPETGGMGTTVLYVAGAVIVLVAALGLAVVLRKRQNAR